jgi:hypothetical protein
MPCVKTAATTYKLVIKKGNIMPLFLNVLQPNFIVTTKQNAR